MKKRIFCILAALLLLSSSCALAVVDKSSAYYVADYANVLSDTTEQDVISLNGDLEYYCEGAQIVVVTVEYMDGMYADDYAVQLFNNWGVGSKTANNGMLFVFATKEDKGWLTTGAGISSSFTDSTASSYLDDYFWSSYYAGKYDDGVDSLVTALVHWFEQYYKVNFTGYYDNDYYPLGTSKQNLSINVGAMIWSVIRFIAPWAVFILVWALMADRRRYRYYYSYMGIPMPPYRFWYLWHGPHHHWHGPGGPGGWGGWGGGPGGWGGWGGGPGGWGGGGGYHGGSGFGGGGFSGGGGGGHGGGFGGGGGHVGGGFGGGGFSGGGGGGHR